MVDVQHRFPPHRGATLGHHLQGGVGAVAPGIFGRAEFDLGALGQSDGQVFTGLGAGRATAAVVCPLALSRGVMMP